MCAATTRRRNSREANLALRSQSERAFRLASMNMPAMQMVMYATIVCLLWFGGGMVQTGGLQVGDLTGFPQLCAADPQLADDDLKRVFDGDALDGFGRPHRGGARRRARAEGRRRGVSRRARRGGILRCVVQVPPRCARIRAQRRFAAHRAGADRGRHRADGQCEIHAGAADPPFVRRDRRPGAGGRARRARLLDAASARRHRDGAAKKYAVLRHAARQPALGEKRCERRGAALGLPHRVRGRIFEPAGKGP